MASILTRGAEGLDPRGFSIDEIKAMLAAGLPDQDEKFELIDGEIALMSLQAMPPMTWKSRLAGWFYQQLRPGCDKIPEGARGLKGRPATTFDTTVDRRSPDARGWGEKRPVAFEETLASLCNPALRMRLAPPNP
jgi:hypothetical protein